MAPVSSETAEFFAFSSIIRTGIMPAGYSFPTDFGDAISLTPTGDDWLRRLRTDHHPDLSDPDGKAALLSEFVVDDQLLIDVTSSDIQRVRSFLDRECRKGGSIRFPFVFGRVLDDLYLEMFGNEPRANLTSDETVQFLNKSPAGVFQVGMTIVGPLGLVDSGECRYLVPTFYGPIVHCTDPGCTALHHVRLEPGKTASREAYLDIRPEKAVNRDLGASLMASITPNNQHSTDYRGTLPWLLTNGYSFSERKILLRSLLDDNSDGLREFVNQAIARSQHLRSAQIADRLTEPECLQLLLRVTDRTLVQKLESLIDNGQIIVGETEVRTPFMARREDDGILHVEAQAGKLSVRFMPKGYSLAPLRLRTFLRTLFADSVEELEWILRNQPGNSAFEKLDYYIRSAKLADIVNQLVMSSRSRLLKAIEILPYGSMQVPTNEAGEGKLIRTILWKLGDSLPPPPTVESHLRELVKVLESGIDRSEPQVDRLALEGLRSGGANLFVELERVLKRAVEYAAWLLLNDHFGADRTHRFRYSVTRARQFAAATFVAAEVKSDEFVWNEEGINSLGILIEGLRVLATECESLLRDESKYQRDVSQDPFFASAVDVVDFPFHHTAMILDLTDESARRLISAIRAASAELERGHVAEARNNFSHDRDDFPRPAEIGAACDAVNKAIDILAGEGLLPSVYVLSSSSQDAFGRALTRMVDGEGRVVTLYGPSELQLCGLPPYNEPQVITSGAIIAGGLHCISLAIEENTEFTQMWDSYPRDVSANGEMTPDALEGLSEVFPETGS